jgi:uracil-DNA glycosylase
MTDQDCASAYADALHDFRRAPAHADWAGLPFFQNGAADQVVTRLDERVASGAQVLPKPGDLFRALELTPLHAVRAVILGQDPYPTPGDAHGLAFSYVGAGRLPASLKRIFAELAADLGGDARTNGDLTGWARQGVLLLNAALSVEAGRAGAHARLGWEALTDQVVRAIAARPEPSAFILWGEKARAVRPLVGERHAVVESSHPSPLAARGDFLGSRPFSRSNAFLIAVGRGSIDWIGER